MDLVIPIPEHVNVIQDFMEILVKTNHVLNHVDKMVVVILQMVLVHAILVTLDLYVNLHLLLPLLLQQVMTVKLHTHHGLVTEFVIKVTLDITPLSAIGMVVIVDHHLSQKKCVV
jgi:hypothetical protein